MTDLVDPNEPVAIDPPTYEYSWDFDFGLGPWTTWLAPSVVHEAGGQYENFTRLNAPGNVDPNHYDGIGALRLVAHLSIPVTGSPGVMNLTDAEFQITIRGTDFQANGAKLVVWVCRYVPEEDVIKNYYVNLTVTNWANTGNDIAAQLSDEWQTITVSLSNNPADWTYAGTNNSQQGDWADRYQPVDLDDALAYTDATLHLVLVSDEPDQAPTGFLDIANITVRTQTPAAGLPGEQPEIFYGLEDQATEGTLAGDPSVDMENATFSLVGGSVTNGVVTIDPDTGAFSFTPNPDFFGPTDFVGHAGFRYQVTDGVTTVEHRAFLFIGPINDAPTTSVANENVDIAFGQPFEFTLFNGLDVDRDERLTYHLVPDGAANGTVSLNPDNGRYVFTPAPGFSGTASFSYYVSDGQIDSAPRTVTLTVHAQGDPPTPVTYNQALDFLIAGDAQTFAYYAIQLADAGDVNAAYHYGTFLGAGRFVPRDMALSAYYLGLAVNHVPDANLQLADRYLSGDGVDKDYGAARALLEALPNNATALYRLGVLENLGFGAPRDDARAVELYLQAANLGSADAMYTVGRRYLMAEGVEYSPSDAYFWLAVGLRLNGGPPGIAQFDNLLLFNMNQAAVDLTPEQRAALDAAAATWVPGQEPPVNDAPLAGDEVGTASGPANVALSGTLAEGSDADGNAITYSLVPGSAQNGVVTIDPQTGAYVFTPAPGYVGPASFRYVVTDGDANSAETTVNLEFELVTAAAPDASSLNEDSSLEVGAGAGLLANDSVSATGGAIQIGSVNGQPANVGQPVAGAYGSITINADGSYTYVANPGTAALLQGETVTETFTYTIIDGANVTATATLTLTVNGVGGTVVNGSGVIIGSAFGDVLTGGVGFDTILGQGGDDVITGGDVAADELYGGAGNDTFIVSVAGDTIIENPGEGIDTVRTSTAAYTLRAEIENLVFTGEGTFEGIGNDSANTLTGGAGADVLSGLVGDDILIGGAGADTLNGGDGLDTASYVGASAGVVASLRTQTGSAGEAAGDVMTSVENLTGSAFDDTLSGAAGTNVLNGGAGIDTVDYSAAAAGVAVQLNTGSASNDGDGGSDTVVGFENVIGSAFNDLLVGDAQANVLSGGLGSDTLLGLAGDDVLIGGAVSANTMQGGLGNDRYVVSLAGDSLTEFAGEGTDTVETALAAYTLKDHFENLTFTGAGSFNGTGNALNNVIIGAAGDDVLTGGAGADTLHGGDGVDTANYAAAAAAIAVSLRSQTGSLGDAAGDILTGVENLIGSAFDDVLSGGVGANRLNGGAGLDTVDYSAAAAGVTVKLNGGVTSDDGDGGADVLVSIENATGSAFNDTLIGDGAVNVLRGGLGADTLLGLGGNDVLWGGAGALNTLQGGLGDDVYVLEAADTVFENAAEGTDTVDARINTYILANNVENLIFGGTGNFAGTGNALANVITGGAGADVLRGGGGIDVLNGGLGIDTADYTLAAAGVVARIDLQRATNDGDGTTDTYTSIENLIGSNFNDVLIGDNNANVLMGGIGTDTLLGFGGDDILMGGSGGGNNQLQGGQGNDWYIIDAFDTCYEVFGEGIDTVEARVGSYTLGNNVENLLYTGPGKFTGNGNALDNVITGGALDDVLRGKGGNDTIYGGTGLDEVQLRGVSAEYTVTAEGAGWRIVDLVADRDGSTYVESIERLRYANNATQILTYGAPGALEPVDKSVGEAFGDPLITNPLDDDGFVLPKSFDGPQVLPAPVEEGLFIERFDLAERIAMWRQQMDGGNNPLVIDGPEGPHRFHDGLGDTDPWS